jgi:xylulokinase
VLGIDVGTGGTRALLVNESGVLAGAATAEHVPFASPQTAWAEQDANDWWRACQTAVRKVLELTGISARQVACVGLSGQMHGAVLLDEKDRPLRPAIIWCDQRSADESAELARTPGNDAIIKLTCNPPLTNFTLTKLLWVRKHEPALWQRFRRLLLPKDFVRLRLTGTHAMDVAEASGTLLLDVARRRWSKEMLELAGLREEALPDLYESPEICGHISHEGAQATALIEGTPVVAGAGDQAAGAVGMGVVRPGAVSATIGTSGVLFAATERPAMDSHGRLHTFCHAVPGRWHVMGVTQAAGLSLRWFRDRFGANGKDGDPYASLVAEAATAPPGSDGVLWAPYLMGERTPHLDPDARGGWVGLAASHTRAHLVRAILEGVAFSLRDTFTIFAEMQVPVESIRLGGGGARSPLWRQIQADVYNHPVEIIAAEEGAAYGAALLAGVGAGFWRSVDDACGVSVRVSSRVEPDRLNASILNARYSQYRQLYPALRSIFAAATSRSGA